MRRFLASWFGTGHIPRILFGSDAGAGTLSALVALVPAVLLGLVGWWAQLLGAAAVSLVGLWVVQPFAEEGDPGWITIDEAAGTFLAVVGLGGWFWLVAFGVFRMADITKALPGVAASEGIQGSAGIMADDLVAGVWGLGSAWLLHLVVG